MLTVDAIKHKQMQSFRERNTQTWDPRVKSSTIYYQNINNPQLSSYLLIYRVKDMCEQ